MKKILVFIVSLFSVSLHAVLLQEVARRNLYYLTRVLLRIKSVDEKDSAGWTALIHAAYYGRTEIVRLLLSHGASVDMKDNCDFTALMRAAWKGHTEIVRMLLAHKASVDMQDKYNGWTALIWGVRFGHTEIVSMLLAHKASVDMQDNGGWTALMTAACEGHTETVGLLVDAGASPFIRNKDDRNVIQLARRIPSSVFTTGRQDYLCNKKKQLDDEKNRRVDCLQRWKELNPEAPISTLPNELLRMIVERTLGKGYEQLERDQQEWKEYLHSLTKWGNNS